MQIIIIFNLFCILLLTLLASPAPLSIEAADVILIFLTGMTGVFCVSRAKVYPLERIECDLILGVILYLIYLLLSMLIGLWHGVPLLNVLRSIGPYLNFFPLLLIGFLSTREISPWKIGFLLISIGLMQAGYHFYLYFTHAGSAASTLGVLIHRITLTDPRTTLPLFISVAMLPLVWIFTKKASSLETYLFQLMGIVLVSLGLLAGLVTLTRAIILSILFGWMIFILVYLFDRARFGPFAFLSSASKLIFYLSIIGLLVMLLSFIPSIHLLEQGLLARFSNDAAFSMGKDYSNGRLFDEWAPALSMWMNADWLSRFFGVGAGNSFRVLTGEERTYIHNFSIYSLVYGGFFGLFTYLWLYFILFKTLIARACQTGQTIYFAFTALLASLFFYGQLFAVHKVLSFNAMIFLMIAIALSRPIKEIKSES